LHVDPGGPNGSVIFKDQARTDIALNDFVKIMTLDWTQARVSTEYNLCPFLKAVFIGFHFSGWVFRYLGVSKSILAFPDKLYHLGNIPF
jgi:hypothetical protein